MNLARRRFPVSIRHDVIVPALVVFGLWGVAGWYYATNTYSGGAIALPDQAIAAAMRAPCVAQQPDVTRASGWQAVLEGGDWLVQNEFRVHFWRHPNGYGLVKIDAQTGRVIECRLGPV